MLVFLAERQTQIDTATQACGIQVMMGLRYMKGVYI